MTCLLKATSALSTIFFIFLTNMGKSKETWLTVSPFGPLSSRISNPSSTFCVSVHASQTSGANFWTETHIKTIFTRFMVQIVRINHSDQLHDIKPLILTMNLLPAYCKRKKSPSLNSFTSARGSRCCRFDVSD